MMWTVLFWITVAAALPTFWLVMRYNLHMFQLNGYKNAEHMTWIKKNAGKQALLVVSGVLGVVLLFVRVWGLLAALLIVFLITIRYYFYLKKSNQKKKLVYTKRVQRQVVTDILLNVIALVLVDVFAGFQAIPGCLAEGTACKKSSG